MANDECASEEWADMVERASARFRVLTKGSAALPLPKLRALFELELQREIERRAAARAQGAAARREMALSK